MAGENYKMADGSFAVALPLERRAATNRRGTTSNTLTPVSSPIPEEDDPDLSIYSTSKVVLTVPSNILKKVNISSNEERRFSSQQTYRHIVHKILESPFGEEGPAGSTLSTIKFPSDQTYKGLMFDDGERSIDFVLAYEVKKGSDGVSETEQARTYARKRFLHQLLKAGVEMETAYQYLATKCIVYIKLYLPFTILCAYAEHLSFRAPLQEVERPDQLHHFPNAWIQNLYDKLGLHNPHTVNVPLRPRKYYTCPFKIEKLDRFVGGTSVDRERTFFSSIQRAIALYYILRTTAYGKRSHGEVGLVPLIDDSVFTAAYPLHDEKLAQTRMRPILHKYWANYAHWYKLQPLDHIRSYFGETVSIYFAWLGFYTTLLIPAAVVGAFVFIYGVLTLHTNRVAEEVCSSGKEYPLCPPCDECSHTYLSASCQFVRYGYLFDHPGTVFYAIFTSFWAVFFLKFWKRHVSRLAFEWDCLDYNELLEKPRPDYTNLAPLRKKNPITGEQEPYFPRREQLKRKLASLAFILFMIAIVLMFILACIVYRILISVHLARIPWEIEELKPFSSFLAASSGTVINLVLILIMGYIYQVIGEKLTQWEMHRTQSEYDDSFSMKVFVFQFVNYYSSIFYVAFIKGKFVGYPGHYYRVLGLRNEVCTLGGCMIELALQLMVIMVGVQIVNNLTEIILPWIQGWWQTRSLKPEESESRAGIIKQRWEADYELIPNEGLFNEYLEMILQFGFITIFVAACPLAPLFALINNWVEIRLDAGKFLSTFRRPVVVRAQDIGVWSDILHVMAHIAVLSNAFLIAFTSEFLPRLYYQHLVRKDLVGFANFTLSVSHHNNSTCLYAGNRDESGNLTETHWHLLSIRLLFVIVFEHFVFGVRTLIDYWIPDVPASLDITIKREQFLAKQALAATAATSLVNKQQLDEHDDEEKP